MSQKQVEHELSLVYRRGLSHIKYSHLLDKVPYKLYHTMDERNIETFLYYP